MSGFLERSGFHSGRSHVLSPGTRTTNFSPDPPNASASAPTTQRRETGGGDAEKGLQAGEGESPQAQRDRRRRPGVEAGFRGDPIWPGEDGRDTRARYL